MVDINIIEDKIRNIEILMEKLKKREEEKEEKRKKREEEKEEKRKKREEEKEEKRKKKEEEKEEKRRSKPLNVDEVANWGAQILKSVPFVAIEDTKELWIYTGNKHGYYEPSGERFLEKLTAMCGDNRACDPGVLRRLEQKIRGSSYKKRSDFIHPEGLVNMINGVYDINNDVLLEHDSKYCFQSTLDISFDKKAVAPVLSNTLKNMFDNEEDYIRTLKWLGYHFYRENTFQVAHLYYGESGSGRSQMMRVFEKILGESNVTNIELQSFSRDNTYVIASMYGKIANIIYDGSVSPIYDAANLRKVISGDKLNARNIYEKNFSYRPYTKITGVYNKLPFVQDSILETKEFKRRWILTHTKVGYEKEDPNIFVKYMSELPGIFNMAIEGYRLLKDEGFKYNLDINNSVWKDNMYCDHPKKIEHKLMTGEELDKLYDEGNLW